MKRIGLPDRIGQIDTPLMLVAVTYENREPAGDFAAVLRHVHEHAADLGIDPGRIGVWDCSGNVPTALFALLRTNNRSSGGLW
jgi:hypothetical protein